MIGYERDEDGGGLTIRFDGTVVYVGGRAENPGHIVIVDTSETPQLPVVVMVNDQVIEIEPEGEPA